MRRPSSASFPEAARAVWERGRFEVERIDEIERETRHDVIAFLTNLAEHVGPEARFVHQGMTSSDVLDTCLAVQLKRGGRPPLADLDALLAALKRRAFEHKYTPTIGRSHGIHAEPTTFGLKLAGHYAEFARNRARLVAAREEIATCAISGAVGTFANIDPRVEAHVAQSSGSQLEPVSTQIDPARPARRVLLRRSRIVASGIERLATEIRHLQRTEMSEAEEYFAPGPEGLLGDAAQAQPGLERESDRARAHGARRRSSRRWRTSRSGTSGTSRIRRSSG